MKKLFVIILLFTGNLLMAQNLDSLWREIELAQSQGKLSSLHPKISKALFWAREQNNPPFVAKALFFQGKVAIVTSDETDDINPIFRNFVKEIESSNGINEAFYQIYLSKLYELYFQENRWKIKGRSELQDQTSDDIRFWSENGFRNKIDELYSTVLKKRELLLNAKSINWKEAFVLEKDRYTQQLDLTPTLFDVFSQYYSQSLEGEKQWLQYKNLAEDNFDRKNTAAYLYNQSKFLQLRRDSTYLSDLEELAKSHLKNWYAAEILNDLSLAYYHRGQAEKKVEDFEKVFGYEKLIKEVFPDSEAAKAIVSTANAIRSRSFHVEVERYIPENQNTPIKISHRNLDRIYVRILDYNIGVKDPTLQMANDALNSYNKDAEKRYSKFLKDHKVIQSYYLDLKRFDDYQTHSAIFGMKPLVKGRYIVLFSQDENFKFSDENILSFAEINVSDKAVEFNGRDTFTAINRNSGKPLKDLKIQVYKLSYIHNKESLNLVKTITTNSKGEAKYIGENYFVYKLADESIFYGRDLYRYRTNDRERIEPINTTKFFTDRAIYRPGQIVYFKGIVMKSKAKEVTVISNQKITVSLHDANDKSIAQLELTTNEFGSVHGEFVLPASVLTGGFSLRSSINGIQYVQIEEYKRPKFKVELALSDKTYKLEDSISVSGKALAFSGANISHGRVNFEVYRQAIYPYRHWGKPIIFEPEKHIVSGTSQTDLEGNFNIAFNAVPARKQSGDNDIRTYVYRVVTIVQDVNGETQTATNYVTVGDKSLLLSADLPNKVSVNELETFNLKVTNLNGIKVKTEGHFKLIALIEPGRILRKTPFNTDYQFYSYNEFVKLFPNEPFGDEANPESWKQGEVLFSADFNSANSETIKIPQTEKIKSGYYLISISSGDVQNNQLIYVTNQSSKTKDLFVYQLDKTSYGIGDVAKITLSSVVENLYVYFKQEVDGAFVKEEILRLNGKPKTILIPVKKEYLGGIYLHYKYYLNNSYEQGSIRLEIPFEHKKLEISTNVLRDKLTPGTTEKWQFTVKGQDKVVAEFLAAMYDASLDQFASNSFDYFAYDFYNQPRLGFGYTPYAFSTANIRDILRPVYSVSSLGQLEFATLNLYDFSFYSRQTLRNYTMRGRQEIAVDMMAASPAPMAKSMDEAKLEEKPMVEKSLSEIQARRALQETAFFYPNLKTDKDGNVTVEFTVPESLTEWKFMAFAHTADMKSGYFENRIHTQKELMVVPNVPRFLREGDEIVLSTKVVNLAENSLTGTGQLLLFDAVSGVSLDTLFLNLDSKKVFSVAKGSSTVMHWKVKVPKNISAVLYRFVASSGSFSDGEESVLPVLTNRMLVTETLPIFIKENQKKSFVLEKLSNSSSSTAENFKLTFEMTSNPAWYAIFSLPYLREYPFEGSEQVFSRFYANLISKELLHSQPKIKAVFDDWNKQGQLKSKLELNQELKNIILEETPWVNDALSEEDQMKRIAVLFDLNKMQFDLQSSFDKLAEKQMPSGGFAWFDGGRENEFITTYIVSGFGNLKKMGVDFQKYNTTNLIERAISYLDQQQLAYFNQQKNRKINDQSNGIQYLYARSFFLEDFPVSKSLDSLIQHYRSNLKKDKLQLPLQVQAMAALVLNRFDAKEDAAQLIIALKEEAVLSDEMGMYWKSNQVGWNWYQAPVETQAMLIEAFDEVANDEKSIELMKVWLLKNRQTHQWSSTKATTKAVYALLNTGKKWINQNSGLNVQIGGIPIDLDKNDSQSGSGYIKKTWNKEQITASLSKVEVEKTSPGVAWGALYWQYFENLDKISTANTGIKFQKGLFLKRNTGNGPELVKIDTQSIISVGDLITVRLEISVDRDMEFVYIKDMRASGLEPVNVHSGYRWQEGFGYYESTRDVATHFFADYLPKGTYVFEYTLRVNNPGYFSNGITLMQNFYAPELNAYSEGGMLRFDEIKN